MRRSATLVALCVAASASTCGCSRSTEACVVACWDLSTGPPAADFRLPEDATQAADLIPLVPDLGADDMAGGPQWHEENSGTALTLSCAWGRNADDVWIGGEFGTVLHSTTRGKQWSLVDIGAPKDGHGDLFGLGGIGLRDLYIAGAANTVFHSTDAGTSWTAEHPNLNGTDCCNNLATLGDDVYVVGGGGGVHHSTVNTPGVWTAIPVGKAFSIEALLPLPNGRIYVGSTGGRVWYSANLGQTWIAVQATQDSTVWAFWSPDGADAFYAAGCRGFLDYTTDAGQHWQVQKPLDLNSGDCIWGLWGSAPGDLYALGYPPGFLHSSDGQTWAAQPNPSHKAMAFLRNVWGSAANDVYIVGSPGVILHYY